jgi:hypothetical protein
MYLWAGASGTIWVAIDGQREQRGGERFGARADLHDRFTRERGTRVGSLSIREKVAMAVQRNRDDRSQIGRSAPCATTGHALSLGEVRLHDAINHSLNRCFIAAGIRL